MAALIAVSGDLDSPSTVSSAGENRSPTLGRPPMDTTFSADEPPAKAEARWVAHLAALVAVGQPTDAAGSDLGAQLAQVLEALCDCGDTAREAADGLWACALGR